jgi:hypothetical protein
MVQQIESGTPIESVPASSEASTPWKDLSTKGFVVIPSFLTAAEIMMLRSDFAESVIRAESAKSAHGPGTAEAPPVSDAAMARLRPKLLDVAARVRAETGVDVDRFGPYSLFFSTTKVKLPLHQDHDTFFVCEDHVNYLNFYMPLMKDDPGRSGITIVPYDAIKARSASALEKVQGRGAQAYTVKGGKTHVRNDSSSARSFFRSDRFVFDFDIEELTVSPRIAPGDLCLMRGDMIHRTQDNETPRLSASIRMVSSRSALTRRSIVNGPLLKLVMQSQNREIRTYQRSIVRVMDRLGRDEISYGEFLDEMGTEMTGENAVSLRSFVGWLARERFGRKTPARSGV